MPWRIHGGEIASERLNAGLGLQVEPALHERVIPSTD